MVECTTTSAPSVERTLQVRRRERVVDHDARAARRGRRLRPRRCRRCRASGSSASRPTPPSSRRPSRRASASGDRAGRPRSSRRRSAQHLRHEPERPAVRVVRDDDVVAGREQRASTASSAASPLANARPWRRALERRDARLRARPAWGCPTGRTRSPGPRRPRPGANVVARWIGTTTAPVAGSASWPAWST